MLRAGPRGHVTSRSKPALNIFFPWLQVAGAPDSKQATHANPPSAASLRPLVLVLDLDSGRFAEDLAKPPVTNLEVCLSLLGGDVFT